MLSYGRESSAEARAIAEALAAQTVAFNEFGYVE
jgi:ABC-type sulfate transport system substrate-binding protein